MAPWLASSLDQPSVGLQALPFIDDLLDRYSRHGVDGLVTMPPEWWIELAPIGTVDDAREHIASLEAAGVDSIGLFPPPDVDVAMRQVDNVLMLAAS